MADPDIPLAYASSVDVLPPPTAPMAQAQVLGAGDGYNAGGHSNAGHGTLLRGRSKRVVMQSGKEQTAHVLTHDEIDSLKSQGFTEGLIESLQQNSVAFPLRIWVVDNSGSMAKGDGKRMISPRNNKRDVKLVSCTRWTEIQETVDYHAQMARVLQVPTVFRLLNDPGRAAGEQQFSIGERGPDFLDEDLAAARRTMRQAQPTGVTPLALHVREIRQNILALLPQLQEQGGKVVVVLATDGLPTDEMGYSNPSAKLDFQNALRSLEGLPVWVVVRLCTDEEDIVDYYNNLDSQLELSLEVLDDFCGEAEEVHEHNPWLNYALPLHRMREMGFHHRLFDLLDERPFTLDELRDFLFMLFGSGKFDGVEDPQVDFKAFTDSVYLMLKNESHQWNPVSKKMAPWIDLSKLKRMYGKKTCTIM